MVKTKVFTFPDGTPLDTLESLPSRKRRRPFPITGHDAVVAATIARANAGGANAPPPVKKPKAKVDPTAPKRQARYRPKYARCTGRERWMLTTARCPIAINERSRCPRRSSKNTTHTREQH